MIPGSGFMAIITESWSITTRVALPAFTTAVHMISLKKLFVKRERFKKRKR